MHSFEINVGKKRNNYINKYIRQTKVNFQKKMGNYLLNGNVPKILSNYVLTNRSTIEVLKNVQKKVANSFDRPILNSPKFHVLDKLKRNSINIFYQIFDRVT